MTVERKNLEPSLDLIAQEYIKAKEKFNEFYNLHEAYAVLLEEVEEFWEVVKLNQDKNPDRMVKALNEAIQIGAMALGIIYEFRRNLP